ncbi:DUF6603 domain-containing protein [Thalassotalea fusca]
MSLSSFLKIGFNIGTERNLFQVSANLVRTNKEVDIVATYKGEEFEIGYTPEQRITAKWVVKGQGKYLSLKEIANFFGIDIPDLPKKLNLNLKSASFTYDSTRSIIVMEAESLKYGKAVLVARKNSQQHWEFYFGIKVDNTINLSNLPLIKQELDPNETLAIKELQVLITTIKLTPNDDSVRGSIKQINELIAPEYPKLPLSLTNQVAVTAVLDLAGDTVPLAIGASKGSASDVNNNRTTAVLPSSSNNTPHKGNKDVGAHPANHAADGTTWFEVQKNFGPVHVQKIGIKYQHDKLWFLVNASLDAAGLDISVIGLSIGSSLADFSPQFNIEGLGLSYQEPSLTISGAFEKIPLKAPVIMAFSGCAIVQTEEMGITAIGSYAEFGDHSSMFLFADVKGDFGGPGCFFITGLCGGLGYNSKLRIPKQNEIYQFPFVKATLPSANPGDKTTPSSVSSELSDNAWITPSAGDMWICAGLQFTTYEMINSTAMLIAELGSKFQLALVGQSNARFPLDGNEVYAYIELQLEALFEPKDGYVSFTAVLSRNSYLYDPDCHLTGGFAMEYWFGENQHAGDYVLTLGGYSPYFNIPKHYPSEPRLAFNWAVDSSTSISGGVYFALTPAAIMAGGTLDIRFHDGKLKAWFTAHADVLVWYHPFHFVADVGVDIGASYKLFGKTFSVDLGADLTLWGPATGGKAKIHWWVISFTVEFGASATQSSGILTWQQFAKLLPAKQSAVKITPSKGLATASNNKMEEAAWTVRSEGFQFITRASMPITELYLGDANNPRYKKDKVNIKPMAQAELVSSQVLRIYKESEIGAGKEDVNLTSWCDEGEVAAIYANLPSALWGSGEYSMADHLIEDQLIGLKVTVPKAKPGKSTGVIKRKFLQSDPLAPGENPLFTQTRLTTDSTTQLVNEIPDLSATEISQQQSLLASLKRMNLKNLAGVDFAKLPLKSETKVSVESFLLTS